MNTAYKMTSLFENMEFSLQPEDYLDQTFGLSAEILAADLNTDGGILDLGHSFSDGLKPQYPVSTLTGPDESIDDLLFQDADGGEFNSCCFLVATGIDLIQSNFSEGLKRRRAQTRSLWRVTT